MIASVITFVIAELIKGEGMRVLFTTTNWKGVYFCMIPLGWALQAAGHDVRVACAPSQSPALSQAGLIPVPILEHIDAMQGERIARCAEALRAPENAAAGVPLIHPRTGQPLPDLSEYDIEAEEPAFRQRSADAIDRNYEAAVRFARAWRPDLVVHDLLSPEGVLAARVTQVPSVYHSPGLFTAREASLKDPAGAFQRHEVDRDQPLISYVIDPTPGAFTLDHGDALAMPVRYIPYSGPAEMPLWLADRPARHRICLMWGYSATSIFGTAVPALAHAIEAVAARGGELVLTAAPEQVDALGELPGNVRVLREFPVHLLLAGSHAIIHQGGVNPVMIAAAAGVPQLSLALTDDQMEMSRRFIRGGSGLCLPGLHATYEQVSEAVNTLLTDERLRIAARRIKADIASRPSPAVVAVQLERLARTGQLTAADISDTGTQQAADVGTGRLEAAGAATGGKR